MKKFRNIFIIFLVLLFLVIGIGPRQLWSNAQQIYNKWMILTMILEKIERFYVDEKDPDNLLEDAIDGMLFGLDPHSTYLTPDEYKDYSKKYQGYFGFGLKYCRLDSHLVVTSLVKGGPADLAGVHVGDRIIKIAGKKTIDMTNDEMEQFLARQEKLVTMLVQRPNLNERFSLDIVKRQVLDDTVPSAFMIQQQTAYVKISYFSSSTPAELDRALAALENSGMQRLILDLRNNTGGTFEAGVAVADRFIPSGKMIVFTRGRAPQSSQQFIARMNRYDNIPMVVLVNEATASDAEIVAGALQDWDRAIIAGQKTYGKALVQTEYAFQDESVLLLTTARYYTPLGRLIQKEYNVDEKDSDKKDKEPQQYKTPKGRVVYGGGGIQPDNILKRTKQEFPKKLQPLYTRDENIFFKYADSYVASHAELAQQPMDRFVQQFKVNSTIWNEFVTFLGQTKTSVSQSDIQANAEFLKNELKVEIAGRLWGDEGRFAVITINDPDVLSGIKYFDQATALLQK